MELNLEKIPVKNNITSYEPGKVTISNNIYNNSILVTPENLLEPWHITKPQELSAKDIQQLCKLQPEIILIGCGKHNYLLGSQIFLPAIQQKIGLEVMPTCAACRTYAILAAERRNVLAALIV